MIHNTCFAMCNVYLVEIFASHDSRRSFKFFFNISNVVYLYEKKFNCKNTD